MPEKIFRLLTPVGKFSPPSSACIELCGTHWMLTEFTQISDAPPYTCISYSWGKGRTRGLLEDQQQISDRTIPALETVIKVSRSQKCLSDALEGLFRQKNRLAEKLAIAHKASQGIWIDALCVPYEQSARELCLRSWGAIFGAATQVISVLPATCAGILQKISNSKTIELEDLLAAEANDWVTRAWIYQEIANSKIIFFATEGCEFLVNHIDFLNGLLTGTTDYADAEGLERIDLAAKFPRLESMQDLFAELQLVEYEGRSAYRVISAMHQRLAEQPDDRIYAMIGLLSDELLTTPNNHLVNAAEHFRQICEAKGDYSFIFTTGPRSEVPGKKWRPIGDHITPIMPGLLASGQGLSGHQQETHLQLDNMCLMGPSHINSVVSAIGSFIGKKFQAEILNVIRQRGFTGCGDYLSLEHGYFFSQSPLPKSKDLFVAISNDVIFAQGAPALLLRSNNCNNINDFCDTGVFIGRSPAMSESINVS